MAQRIAAHRAARPTTWHTVEAPQHLAAALLEVQESPDAILVDCLTLLVSNILLAREAEAATTIEAAVRTELEGLLLAQNQLGAPLIIVSNEVGLGLVPPYPLGRVYRDVLGRANQYLVSRADRVIFMVAGLPMAVKG
jgi:adenosylcobinamide kinase/adenosylcobinamide-phosphate guanylyltransferase